MCEFLGLLCVSAVLGAAVAGAAEPASPVEKSPAERAAAREGDKTNKQVKPPPAFTPEREAAAIEFVRRHHPELAKLLAHLKKVDNEEYRRAVGSLFRASERLAHIQERNPERYERELKAWKLKSRIQLLVARVRLAPEDEKPRQELKQALLEQFELTNAQILEERKKLLDRIEKLDSQIKNIPKDRDSHIEKQLELLLRDRKKADVKEKSGRAKTPAGGEPNGGAADGSRFPKRPVPAAGSPQPASFPS